MAHWEYTLSRFANATVDYDKPAGQDAALLLHMDAYGKVGWEAVNVNIETVERVNYFTIFWKRQKI